MQLFVLTPQYFKKEFNILLPLKTWKNHPQKLLKIRPDPFFQYILPIGPNPALISISVPLISPTAGLLYNDFATTYALIGTRHFCIFYTLIWNMNSPPMQSLVFKRFLWQNDHFLSNFWRFAITAVLRACSALHAHISTLMAFYGELRKEVVCLSYRFLRK